MNKPMTTAEIQEAKRQHDLSHRLARAVLKLTERFGVERHPVQTVTILVALEMAASVMRRVVRDTGMPKETMETFRKAASECGADMHEEMYGKRAHAEADQLRDVLLRLVDEVITAHAEAPAEVDPSKIN